MPVQFTTAEIAQKYDGIATQYDRLDQFAEFIIFGRLRRSWFRRATGDVLEIAVGTGRNLQFYPPSCRITGVDVSQGMMRIARERAARLGREVCLEQMNAEQLTFPDDAFDTVTSSLSTCTFPDPLAALREMGRVCKPTGRILLLEHGRSRFATLGRVQDRFADGHARRVACHWNRDPRRLVEQAGLRLISDQRSLLGVLHLIEAAP